MCLTLRGRFTLTLRVVIIGKNGLLANWPNFQYVNSEHKVFCFCCNFPQSHLLILDRCAGLVTLNVLGFCVHLK